MTELYSGSRQIRSAGPGRAVVPVAAAAEPLPERANLFHSLRLPSVEQSALYRLSFQRSAASAVHADVGGWVMETIQTSEIFFFVEQSFFESASKND